jgi:hypothetical protein
MPHARVITTAAILALVTLSGCKEEDTRLFDETGVWALEKYSLDGSPFEDINQARKNRFLLRFMPNDPEIGDGGIVAAAACHEMGSSVDVTASSCTNAAYSQWSCQCFVYTYTGSKMVWQEFAPGETPPAVGTPGDGETDGMGSGAHELTVSAFGETAATYLFDPLPLGLFNSDGDLSKHVFQIKADTLWTNVDVDADGTLDLDMCSMDCFQSGG